MTRHGCPSPLRTILAGALAGFAGTLAMDLLWYARYRQDGGEEGFCRWELGASIASYEDAPAPAHVGKRVAEGYLQRELPAESAAAMNNAMHWVTGGLWGAVHGVLAASVDARPARSGLPTGALAWSASYAMLVPAGLYKPMWRYPPAVLWKDLSAHLVFGLGTGAAFRAANAPT